jgi:ankyrin repeat domain-containing protein 50
MNKKCSVCRSLYSSNYKQYKDRNPKRVEGTCEWFLEHPKYRNWLEAESSQLLWISADAGCGKSVLASFLVKKLTNDISDKDTTVCSFFFKDDNTEQRISPLAFSALVHQALVSESVKGTSMA